MQPNRPVLDKETKQAKLNETIANLEKPPNPKPSAKEVRGKLYGSKE